MWNERSGLARMSNSALSYTCFIPTAGLWLEVYQFNFDHYFYNYAVGKYTPPPCLGCLHGTRLPLYPPDFDDFLWQHTVYPHISNSGYGNEALCVGFHHCTMHLFSPGQPVYACLAATIKNNFSLICSFIIKAHSNTMYITLTISHPHFQQCLQSHNHKKSIKN